MGFRLSYWKRSRCLIAHCVGKGASEQKSSYIICRCINGFNFYRGKLSTSIKRKECAYNFWPSNSTSRTCFLKIYYSISLVHLLSHSPRRLSHIFSCPLKSLTFSHSLPPRWWSCSSFTEKIQMVKRELPPAPTTTPPFIPASVVIFSAFLPVATDELSMLRPTPPPVHRILPNADSRTSLLSFFQAGSFPLAYKHVSFQASSLSLSCCPIHSKFPIP